MEPTDPRHCLQLLQAVEECQCSLLDPGPSPVSHAHSGALIIQTFAPNAGSLP